MPLKLCNALDLLAVPGIIGVRSREPGVQDFPGYRFGSGSQAQSKNIRMVPNTRTARGFSIVAQGSSDAWNLIRSKRGTRACPATDDPLVDSAMSDCLGNVTTRQRPISFGIIFSDGTKEGQLMTPFSQFVDQHVSEMGAFVTPECNFHTPFPP